MRTIRVAALAVMVGCAALGGCDDGGSGPSVPKMLPGANLSAGDVGYIVTPGGTNTWICPAEADFDRMLQLHRAKDELGLSEMHREGRLLAVDNGTGCRIIDSGIMKHEVRITEGTHLGKSGFVTAEFVSAERVSR